MPNKIDTDSIVRDRQDKLKDSADQSNATYVKQLEKSSSIMPPEKPFETEAAQNQTTVKEEADPTVNNDFVQNVKDSTNEIERIDKTNEVKLHLLNNEYSKLTEKLSDGSLTKKDVATLESALFDVQDKIELYKSKLQAGAMSSLSGELQEEITDEEGDGEGGGISDTILDGLKDQVITAVPGIFLAVKDDEEEEEEELEEGEKKYD
ncbi:hypothetical protein [Portibacter lacus]|uniref:Uncharacterized protein n=1 Tax=Portibacter lacus TaxID=1099794 RepID=A0AA37SRM6_9BACT|nr:hypothetical protein [Portibacter lacus]GLR18535.1 hypothetical protein GCM10007940_31510 [Portibacter lacus]